MGELIWVGNTLIPRGTVILFVGGVSLAPFMICAIVSLIRAIIRMRRNNGQLTTTKGE